MSPFPESNDASIREHESFGKLSEATPVPDSLEGFEVDNKEELSEVWPEGTEKAKEVSQPLVTRTDFQILERFLYTKTRKEQFKFVSPLTDGAVEDKKDSRIQEYATGRNLVGGDYSSKLSPYLTSGVISGRMVCNEAKKVGKGGKLESGRDTGVGMWVQEVRLPSSTTNLGYSADIRYHGEISITTSWQPGLEPQWADPSSRNSQMSNGRLTRITSNYGRMVKRVIRS